MGDWADMEMELGLVDSRTGKFIGFDDEQEEYSSYNQPTNIKSESVEIKLTPSKYLD